MKSFYCSILFVFLLFSCNKNEHFTSLKAGQTLHYDIKFIDKEKITKKYKQSYFLKESDKKKSVLVRSDGKVIEYEKEPHRLILKDVKYLFPGLVDRPKEKLEFEKKSLGYYLSGHPVIAIDNKIKKIRTNRISDLNTDIKKSSLVCLVNSVRQIKDRKGMPLTFINFDDGSGVMDGIISSEVLENCHNLLKEGSILSLKGSVEVDDYRSNDLGALMFRMRVKEVKSIDEELSKKTKEILIDTMKSDSITLDDFSEKLELIENIFWKEGTCGINLKVQTNESEAIIELGDEYKFKPTLENLFYLEEIFGKDVIQI